jgi:hypothetical protein
MLSEKEWVELFRPRLKESLKECDDKDSRVNIEAGKKLVYANEIELYEGDGHQHHQASYATDLLIYDSRENGDWIPRVVLECKLRDVTTHDALTYSAKAATHKHVHPYLRYGILIGAFGDALPGRLIRHGAYFDFMMVWQGEEPTDAERKRLTDLLKAEIEASRKLWKLLTKAKGHESYRLLHRPLQLVESRDG